MFIRMTVITIMVMMVTECLLCARNVLRAVGGVASAIPSTALRVRWDPLSPPSR